MNVITVFSGEYPICNVTGVSLQILGSPVWRQSLGVDAVLLLTLLVQYRKHEVSIRESKVIKFHFVLFITCLV